MITSINSEQKLESDNLVLGVGASLLPLIIILERVISPQINHYSLRNFQVKYLTPGRVRLFTLMSSKFRKRKGDSQVAGVRPCFLSGLC